MGRRRAPSKRKTRRNPRSNPRGVLRVSAAGYGFVQTAEGEFFVPASKMGGAFDGDMVEIAPTHVNPQHKQLHKAHGKQGDKPSGRVVRVVNRAHESIVGRYEVAEPFGVVVPEDRRIPYDIFTMRKDYPHVRDGDAVRVRITTYPSRNEAATGVIEEVIGRAEDEDLAIDMIVARHKLETAFSDASIEQAEKAEVDVAGALGEGYRDLRDRFVFTIDPADARDFDDAISIDEVDGLVRLGVHIADVSHYVPWNSSIDLDARRRATSVYLVDRVIPMLPEELSNDICSLKPGEPRRAMTADMFLDGSFEVKRATFYPSVIESKARLSYEEAQEALDGDGSASIDEALADKLHRLHEVACGLADARRRAGGIDFDTTEAKVRLDSGGEPEAIVLRRRTDATEMIEEAMVLANNQVASYLSERGFPSVYRVHEPPSPESLAELVPVLQEFDYLKTVSASAFSAGSPTAIQAVLGRAAGRPEAELVSTLVLRSMKRAEYKSECGPHFGLASDAYTHFTSPIRRYPDLIVHRMLKAQLFGKPGTFEQQVHSLAWLAKHSSEMERIAEAAARESQEYKMIEYLSRDVGAAFNAVIAGVASYGFFVRLENTAEGLVPLKELGAEYFALDARRHQLVGQESGTVYRLGQRVRVVLEAAYPRERKLDFRLAPRGR
ncbi:ribonuclease R [Raoultibacter timonensis]|uniref:Ribonuclease R n=1 Tax=Raoultibacter timonensis TaxID=1907662 RepID=A0ABN6MFC1_9ACTN|nr:ribonuclease R [Raoultibacter timonensis]BDE96677.1 ribonuclease R [Raoultibacter timonensis]BDF51280.1 ribonuclease R [Raoultibacter timonensis]